MRSLFSTALQYLEGVPADFYGVDVDDVRATIAAARDDPSALEGWQIRLDGQRPEVREADYAHVETIESGP